MKPRLAFRLALTAALLILLSMALPSCAPASAPTMAPAAMPTRAAAAAQPTATVLAAAPTATLLSGPPRPQATNAPAEPQLLEGRQVELEWPAHLCMGDSDIIRLALVPVKDGYVARAEFPDHSLNTKDVPIPRPNGYELYAVARLDGVGFEIAPTGDQLRFVPVGEEIAWRWSLTPRKPGKQRLSVQLNLRWVPGPGMAGAVRESQAYTRGLDVQVSSFLGLSSTQAASTGLMGLLLGCGCLLAAFVRSRGGQPVRSLSHLGPMQTIQPNPSLALDAPAGLALSPVEDGLLRGLFTNYARLIIENEFLSGYSGARTFLVRPIRPDGCADAPTIVKLGPKAAILQEFENYETFVKDRLPPMTARIQRPPVTLTDGKRVREGAAVSCAAVQYTFIAEPDHHPVSLRRALLEQPDPRLLQRLFETFGPHWWMQRRPYTFRVAQEYDALLPPHYVLEPVDAPHAVSINLTQADPPTALTLAAGDLVRLEPFRRYDLRADGQSYSLMGVSAEGRPALRLRWLASAPPAQPVTARVVSTRFDLLRGWTSSFDRFDLPDPLIGLPAVLNETLAGTRSVIHGDLNLENVLVGPGSLVWLIDFAQTREGHPLFDFAHLESELIAHIFAERTGSPRVYLDLWQSGDDPLLNALHQIAGRCLFDPAHPREYTLSLYLACLGALKYPNLNHLSKHCLYLTAAALAEKLI